MKRIDWIDISRGVAFLLVIYSHLDYSNSVMMHYFGPVFLTVFFFVSGYLYKSGLSFSKVFEHRTRTLLIPLVILTVGLALLSQVFSFHESISLKESLIGLVLQSPKWPNPMWFIAAIYVYSLFFYFIDKYCVTLKSLIITGVVLYIVNTVTYYYLGFNEDKSFWYIHGMGFCLFYMALGRGFRQTEELIRPYFTYPILTISLIIYVALVYVLDKYISCGGSKYIIDSMLVTLLGLFITIGFSQKINSPLIKKLIIFVGANSLLYFAFHGKVYSLLQTVLSKIFYSAGIDYCIGTLPALDFLIAAMITLLDAIILIYPIKLINKYASWVTGKGYKLWG